MERGADNVGMQTVLKSMQNPELADPLRRQ